MTGVLAGRCFGGGLRGSLSGVPLAGFLVFGKHGLLGGVPGACCFAGGSHDLPSGVRGVGCPVFGKHGLLGGALVHGHSHCGKIFG